MTNLPPTSLKLVSDPSLGKWFIPGSDEQSEHDWFM